MTEYNGPERRNEKPGRRGRDYDTCMFHETQCQSIGEIQKAMRSLTPSWVVVLLVTVWIAVTGGVGFMVKDVRDEVKEISEKMQIIGEKMVRLEIQSQVNK